MHRQLKKILLISSLFLATHAFALSAPNVPIDDRVYKDIDRLIAAKLVKPTIVGQRPYSRSEIARMIAEAIQNRQKLEAESTAREAYINKILDHLIQSYHDEMVVIGAVEGTPHPIIIHPIEKIKGIYTYLKSHQEMFPTNNGVGTIDAKINTFQAYKEGVPFQSGSQVHIESEHRAQFSKYFSIYARPLFKLTGGSSKAYIQNLYAKFEVANIELEVGRDSLVWGQGEYGPLLISNNARPLDLIKLTNPSPVRLPSFLKYIGPVRASIFVSNLGPEQPHKYPYLAGYKLSILPFDLWELGLSHTVMMGGGGMRSIPADDAILEFLGIRAGGMNASQTNHLVEFETALTIPPLRYTRIYLALNNEDKRDTIKRFFKDGSAYLGGIYIPRLTNSGDADLRLEYYHTSPITYRHSGYSNGYTLNRNIIGSALGPNADGVHIEYHHDIKGDLRLDFTLEFNWERRGSNIYTTTTDPDGTWGDIVVEQHRPYEHRFRINLRHHWPLNNRITIESLVGYERIHNKNFISGKSGNDAVFAVSFSYNFDPFFKYPKD